MSTLYRNKVPSFTTSMKIRTLGFWHKMSNKRNNFFNQTHSERGRPEFAAWAWELPRSLSSWHIGRPDSGRRLSWSRGGSRGCRRPSCSPPCPRGCGDGVDTGPQNSHRTLQRQHGPCIPPPRKNEKWNKSFVLRDGLLLTLTPRTALASRTDFFSFLFFLCLYLLQLSCRITDQENQRALETEENYLDLSSSTS